MSELEFHSDGDARGRHISEQGKEKGQTRVAGGYVTSKYQVFLSTEAKREA